MDSETPMDHWHCAFRNASGHMMSTHFSTGTGLRQLPKGAKVIPYREWALLNPRNSGKQQYEAAQEARKLPVQPNAADVLDCMASDASGVDGRDFEEWASDYGYDTDSRKAEQTYKACCAGCQQLKAFLGDSFQELVNEIERL